MGQQHIVDLGRVVTGRAQVTQHLTQAGPHALRGAGVDQAEVAAILDQVCVDGSLHAVLVFGYVSVSEQTVVLGRVHIRQLLPRQCHATVEQGSHA